MVPLDLVQYSTLGRFLLEMIPALSFVDFEVREAIHRASPAQQVMAKFNLFLVALDFRHAHSLL